MPRALSPSLLARIVPGGKVVEAERLADGYRNSNFKLRLEGGEPLVLRVYEHDAQLCRKELDLYRLVGSSVPVPEVIHAAPDGLEDFPPFTLLRYIEGISFRELRRHGDENTVAEAARSAGEMLAAIGRIGFSRPGWIAPGPTVTTPLLEGADPVPRFVDRCLAAPVLQARMPAELRDCISGLLWRHSREVAPFDLETRLVHGDFNKRNLLVRPVAGRWQVVAVLDWEFAVSGSPLMDIGNFLRYEGPGRPPVEPHFASGYRQAGGVLPENWRQLSRWIDLTALCALLAEEETPAEVAAEVVAVITSQTAPRSPRPTAD